MQVKNLLIAILLFLQWPAFAQTKAEKTAGLVQAKQAWARFCAAYTKNDQQALKQLIEVPVRENLDPDNPMLDLRAFLTEVKNLKKYNLKKFAPKAEDLREYVSFKGYSFVAGDQYYAVQLIRYTPKSPYTSYTVTLYFKLHKGTCLLFAFVPEIGVFNTGD